MTVLSRSRMLALGFAAVLAAGVMTSQASSEPTPASPVGTVWGSGTLTEPELGLLVSQMTLAEKDAQLHGSSDSACASAPLGCWGQAGWIPGVARLGVPPLRLTDGPAGVRLGHVETAMPAPVGPGGDVRPQRLAAVRQERRDRRSRVQSGRVARADDQRRQLRHRRAQLRDARRGPLPGRPSWSPPRSEGVQGEGMIAQIKHYITNDFENGRNSTSVKVDPQTLHENSLPAFEAGVKAGAGSAMCSYNRINDVYGCGNDYTLNQVLKGELGFKGFVTSDWGATHRTTDIIHGLDMEQSGSSNLGTALINAATNGTADVPATNDYPAQPAYSAGVWLAAMDASVLRIVRTMNSAGLLEGTVYGSHYTDGTPSVPARADLATLRDSDFATAQALAAESATLLKNESKALPLTTADLTGGGVVVMGPTAIAPYTGGGGSAHVIPYDTAPSPYSSLLARAPAGAKLSYVPGYDLDGQLIPATALTAPDPAEGYPNWTLTPADAAFAGQPGLLRQQITTAAVASGAQPVAAARRRTGPARHHRQRDAFRPPRAGVGQVRLTAPSNPGGTGWQLKVFVQNQASSQLFVDGLATAQRRVNLGAYPAAPSNSLPSQGQTAKSHDPAADQLQQGTYSVDADGRSEGAPRPAPDRRREPGQDPVALGPAGQPGSLDRAGGHGRRGGRQGRDLRL